MHITRQREHRARYTFLLTSFPDLSGPDDVLLRILLVVSAAHSDVERNHHFAKEDLPSLEEVRCVPGGRDGRGGWMGRLEEV